MTRKKQRRITQKGLQELWRRGIAPFGIASEMHAVGDVDNHGAGVHGDGA